MIINKITTGFVIQQFDTDASKFVGQSFTCGDEVEYETITGNPIEFSVMEPLGFGPDAAEEPYLPFDMKQPEDQEGRLISEVLANDH